MTIELHQLALYALAYAVMVVSPGPFVAAIAGRAAAFGFRSGVSMAVGAFLAEKIWILAAIFGLALIAALFALLLPQAGIASMQELTIGSSILGSLGIYWLFIQG